MSIKHKLNDPNLGEEETDRIIGAFVRRQETDRLRNVYAKKLEDNYGVNRGTTGIGRAPKRSIIRPLAWLAFAASVLLAVLFWAPWQPTFTTQELLARHLDPAAVVLPTTRSTETVAPGSEEQTRQTFYDNYQVNDYQDALMAARGLDFPTSTDSFFMALAYIGIGQKDTALNIFEQLKNTDGRYREEITWYTALLNWQLGDLEAGLEQLHAYRFGDTYYPSAREFLRAIK